MKAPPKMGTAPEGAARPDFNPETIAQPRYIGKRDACALSTIRRPDGSIVEILADGRSLVLVDGDVTVRLDAAQVFDLQIACSRFIAGLKVKR